MKKILLVTRPICPPWDEASKNFAFSLAKNIGQNFEFSILTNEIISSFPQEINQKPIYTSPNFSRLQKLLLLKYLRKMRNNFDILHYIFTPTKRNTFLIKKFSKSKKARTIQTVATIREDLFSEKQIKSLIFGDKIITYSAHAKEKLTELGFEGVEKIYPGIDLEKFSPASKSMRLMDQWKIEADDFVVSYPGEYTRLGATDDIVDAVMKLKDEKNFKFIFACRTKNNADKKKKDEIAKKFLKKGILDKIIFTDTFREMEKIYNLSDLVIFPVQNMKGKFDIPLAVIEAMACAKPVIVSDLPVLREFANKSNSVIIEKGSIDQLKDSILDLKKDRDKGKQIGLRARKFTEENFNIDAIAEKYKEIYARL